MTTLEPRRVTARRGRPKEAGLPERRREEILVAATQVFAREGYPGTDLQDVADKLGVGKGTLYRYFDTKRSIFQAAVDRAVIGMRRSIDAALVGLEDPFDRIEAAVRAYLVYFDEHPEFVELIMQERAEFRDRKKPTYFAHREANLGVWQKMYADLIKSGRIRDIPVDRITDTLGNVMYGAMFTNYFAGRHKTLLRQADDILDIAFNGLLTDTERARRARGAGKEKRP
ncbi:MAG: TetR/AcrR family transcriptional regulator [Phycisphaerales bacterium]